MGISNIIHKLFVFANIYLKIQTKTTTYHQHEWKMIKFLRTHSENYISKYSYGRRKIVEKLVLKSWMKDYHQHILYKGFEMIK